MRAPARAPTHIVGRYAIYDEVASGGMASVHLGRLVGPIGFSRTVAVKRLHPQFAKDPDFSAMFMDEARLAARIRHPNVVPVFDVVATEGEILLVMEYVHGESFSFLLRVLAANKKRLPARIVGTVMAGALQGLHAAHEATGEGGRPLGIVHRDMSPQNVLLGADGIARVLDFGVAKAVGQAHSTREGQIKGKIRYMAPEHITGANVDRRADIWSASVMLWEALTGKKLFFGDHDAMVLMQVLEKPIPSPREVAPDVSETLSAITMRGLERDPSRRFPSALEMAAQLEGAVGLVSAREVGMWVKRVARGRLEERARILADVDADPVDADSVAPVHASLPIGGPREGLSVGPTHGRRSRLATVMSLVMMAGVGAGAALTVRSFERTPAVGTAVPAAFGGGAPLSVVPAVPLPPAVTAAPTAEPTDAADEASADAPPPAPPSATASTRTRPKARPRFPGAPRPPRTGN